MNPLNKREKLMKTFKEINEERKHKSVPLKEVPKLDILPETFEWFRKGGIL